MIKPERKKSILAIVLVGCVLFGILGLIMEFQTQTVANTLAYTSSDDVINTKLFLNVAITKNEYLVFFYWYLNFFEKRNIFFFCTSNNPKLNEKNLTNHNDFSFLNEKNYTFHKTMRSMSKYNITKHLFDLINNDEPKIRHFFSFCNFELTKNELD